MMTKFKNEQGYALLVVVLLVVLIMGFFTFFMSASLSNTKQEQRVDQHNLSVVAAEMGVDYYTNAITNKFYEQSNGLLEFAQTEIGKIERPVDSDYNNIQSSVRDKLSSDLNNYVRNQLTNSIDPIFKNSIFSFRLNNIKVESKDEYNIFVSGIVHGENTVDANPKILTFDLTFSVPEFRPNPENNSGGGLVIPDFDESQFPRLNKPSQGCEFGNNKVEKISYKDCFVESDLDSDKLTIDNSHLYIGRDMTAKNDVNIDSSSLSIIGNLAGNKQNSDGINNFKINNNSTLYVGEDLEVKNDAELSNNSMLYVRGKLDSKNNFTVSGNTNITVVENMTVKNNVSLDNSTLNIKGNLEGNKNNSDGINNLKLNNNSSLFVGGNLEVKNNPEILGNSILFVGGNLDSKNNFKVSGNSKVCIVGSFSYNNNLEIESGSNIYILGKTKPQSGVTKVDSLEKLKSSCKMSVESLGGIDSNITWDKPNVEVVYE
ncbi:hypothetical protein CWR48_16965 [Oceanobacillus arenosus]|uniref:Uncharacterized protein n=1 Tax=Oceanobacillus arenosus TaxID=1229153 RepID=A0A3D8PMG3_9BACI|nr:hypothetical protein [Oceanobacillus arenosus]RDW16335.1 hypothetical protein CWR48_16965 [Oceanobacillus arenosus]